MALEIDVTKSMRGRSQQDIYADRRLQSIVTDWKNDEEDHHNRSEHSSLNSSQNLELSIPHHPMKESSNRVYLVNKDINAVHKTKLYLSFPLKRLYALGRGSSSIVYKTLKLTNLKIYAEKVLVVSDPVKKKQIIREIESLRSMFSHNMTQNNNNNPAFTSPFSSPEKPTKLTELMTPKGIHPNCQYIVELYDVLQNPVDGTLSLCLEYMNNGSLQDIVNRGGCTNETILASFCFQILAGLQFLHQFRMVHRDVKPSNILLSVDGRIKLSDFGLAKTMDVGHSLADSFIGTFEYMAPERLAGEPYSFSSDIWSFGLSIHTLAVGKFPYNNKKGFWELLHITQQDNRPLPSSKEFSSSFIDLISASTSRNMKDRPTADQLLRHPFVQSRLEIVPSDIWVEFMKSLESRSAATSSRSIAPVDSLTPKVSERGLSESEKSSYDAKDTKLSARGKSNSFTNRGGSMKPPLHHQGSSKLITPRVTPGTQSAPRGGGGTTSSNHNTPKTSQKNSFNGKKSANSTPTHREKAAHSHQQVSSGGSAKISSVPAPTVRSNSTYIKSPATTVTPRSSAKHQKQISLPVIPTATSNSNIPSTSSVVGTASTTNIMNSTPDLVDRNAIPRLSIETVTLNNTGRTSPRLKPHPSITKEEIKRRYYTLQSERRLEEKEVTSLVNEWGRFVIKYFQYEMKQRNQENTSSSSSPEKEKDRGKEDGKRDGGRPLSFDVKSLYVTKGVIKSLSVDMNCSEEILLALFKEKIDEIQRELGSLIQYYDKQSQPPTMNTTLSTAVPFATATSPNEQKKSETTTPYHHQNLTVKIDRSIPSKKKKSVKSVTDFDSTLSPNVKSVLSGTGLGSVGYNPQLMTTIAHSAESLEHCIQLNSKDWENYTQGWNERNHEEDMNNNTFQAKDSFREIDSGRDKISLSKKRESRRLSETAVPPGNSKLPSLSPLNISGGGDDPLAQGVRRSSSLRRLQQMQQVRLSSTSDDDEQLRQASKELRLSKDLIFNQPHPPQTMLHTDSKVNLSSSRNQLSFREGEGGVAMRRLNFSRGEGDRNQEGEEEEDHTEVNTVVDEDEPHNHYETHPPSRSYQSDAEDNIPEENYDHDIAGAATDTARTVTTDGVISAKPSFSFPLDSKHSKRTGRTEEVIEEEEHLKKRDVTGGSRVSTGKHHGDSVLLDMSSILEESGLLHHNRGLAYENDDDEEYEEVHALEEEEDEFGEHTVETVESFVPSPIVTTRKKAKSPTASLTRKEVQSKVRGSQDYSMNFESLAVTHKPKEHNTTHGGHANENYDNEEFEEYQDDEN